MEPQKFLLPDLPPLSRRTKSRPQEEEKKEEAETEEESGEAIYPTSKEDATLEI